MKRIVQDKQVSHLRKRQIKLNCAYKNLENAMKKRDAAEQQLFRTQQIILQIEMDSDPYKIWQLRQWDNRCEFPDDF